MPNAGTKILFIVTEAAPLVEVGGLADVAGALPQALKSVGCDVRLLLPLYGTIDRTAWDVKPYGRPFVINLGGEPQVAQICTSKLRDVPVYFVDHAPTFGARQVIYAGPHEDEARFVIFSALALAALDHLDWRPDILHLNDWHTAMVACWSRTLRRELHTPPTLLTVHNLGYQGIAHRPSLGLAGNLLPDSPDQIINLLYEGLANADTITVPSPTYAQEILTPEYGNGLDHLLHTRTEDLQGILHGIDTTIYDPATDRHIIEHYSADDPAGKAACKRALQQEAGFEVRADVPVFGILLRLVEQKGLDLLAEALPKLPNRVNMQFVMLGTGDSHYQELFKSMAEQWSATFRLWLDFDAALAHRIYAGSDALLMPSRFEPCGLGQMIAMRYGTVPVVRSTGGLVDTVTDLSYLEGTGVRFDSYSADALAQAIQRTVDAFANRDLWRGVMRRGMQQDWGWKGPAQQYGELYTRTIERHRSILAASI